MKKCHLGQKLLEQDKFGQSPKMRLDGGKDALPSHMGALCSIVLLILLVAYAGYKVSVLEGRKAVDILQAIHEDHFDGSYVFGAEQGLNFAVAGRRLGAII